MSGRDVLLVLAGGALPIAVVVLADFVRSLPAMLRERRIVRWLERSERERGERAREGK